ncbi:hypothetical protein QUF56_04680 [Ureibacillus composti]|uniref:4-diphosphocytidyl-2C-methyl-D-erythritol kinase n=1 Tax=Lysinibacillus composti TaxID=720633 RepID=A0A3N9UH02_9BACI|nr:hypothetical protein [Lysinibacillus composti]MBM7607901.1 hypothetical protein [Lysinibacillus composti]MDM5332515.1 hypothetical protein [Ureibacillus composti]RQW75367.1 hypothetical protein EBB45_06360 [Lysinibacillus composti]
MIQEPLLFIPTPPFYYVEVEDQVESEREEVYFEESTSVYEIQRAERVTDLVIARQLSYFSQPMNGRLLQFYLKNGEVVIGMIEELNNSIVKIKTAQESKIINGNDIEEITVK